VFAYAPLGKSFVLSGRLDGRAARGDVPFYQLPYIDMRGIPAARFQDENAAVAEAELRWNITPRWALIGFAGVGRVWGRGGSFSEADNETSKGRRLPLPDIAAPRLVRRARLRVGAGRSGLLHTSGQCVAVRRLPSRPRVAARADRVFAPCACGFAGCGNRAIRLCWPRDTNKNKHGEIRNCMA